MKTIRTFSTTNQGIKYLKGCKVKSIEETFSKCDCNKPCIALKGVDKYNITYLVSICNKCGYKPKRSE